MYLTKLVSLENVSDLDWSEPACYPYIIFVEIGDDVSSEVVDAISWSMKYHFGRANEFIALLGLNRECFQFLNDRLIDLGFNLGEPIEANKIRVHFIPRFAELFSKILVSKEIEVQSSRENTVHEITRSFESFKKTAKGIKMVTTTVLLGANIVVPFVSKILKKS